MTNIPQTISKTFNVLTGEALSGKVITSNPRRTGRTTAIALQLIGAAQYTGKAFATDHQDYPSADKDSGGALYLKEQVLLLINKLGLQGFTVTVENAEKLRIPKRNEYFSFLPECNLTGRRDVYGVLVTFSPVKVYHYDLRKG